MKSLNLTIPSPCHENWDAMHPQANGRHCESCQKVVVDFSKMSDEQLLGFFTKNTQNVCGRFNDFQLDREIKSIAPKKSRWHWIAAVLSFFTVGEAFSQKKGETIIEKASVVQDTNRVTNVVLGGITAFPAKDVIRGKVIDETKQGLPGASLIIEGSKNVVAITDKEGNFVFSGVGLIGKTLVARYIGFNEKKIKITKTDMTVNLSMSAALMGEVVVVAGKVNVSKAEEPKKLPVVAKELSVYPNPVISTTTIQRLNDDPKVYKIRVVNMNGAACEKVSSRLDQPLELDLSSLSPGMYVIEAVNGKEKLVSKIVKK